MANERPTILIIENDPQQAKVLKESLELKKYRVELESTGERSLMLINESGYDIVLVDSVLPDMAGTDFVKALRKTDYITPVLFMSDNADDKDKIHAFCAGGDDYITKPFSTTELALRIYSLLRRVKPEKVESSLPDLVRFGNFKFDYPNRLLCTPSEEIGLTKKESEVLKILVQNMNSVVKRENVLTNVWGENDYFMGRSMDVYIARLRKKLKEDQRVSIVNVHRMGFKLEVRPEASA